VGGEIAAKEESKEVRDEDQKVGKRILTSYF
jgi:hypothetical protein